MPTIKNRRATLAQWEIENPVLAAGEPGVALDAHLQKIGNGFSTWDELPAYVAQDATLLPPVDLIDLVFARLDMRDPGALNIAQASDSTGDTAAEWFEVSWKETLASLWTERPARVRRWDKTNEVPTAWTSLQAGVPTNSESAPGTVFGRALFETPAVNLVGSAPDIGLGNWQSALGTWIVENGAALQTNAGILGVAGFQQLTRNDIDGTYTVEFGNVVTTGATQTFSFYPANGTSAVAGDRMEIGVLGNTALTASLKITIGGTATTLDAGVAGAVGTLTSSPQNFTLTVTINGLNVTATVGGATLNGTLTQPQRDALKGQFLVVSVNKNATLQVRSIETTGVGTAATYLGQVSVYNGGYSGGKLTQNIERMDAMYPVRPDLMFINHGHNYASTDSTPEQFLAAVDVFVATLYAKYPGVPIVVLSQNPETTGTLTTPVKIDGHRARQMALRSHCKLRGWGYIPSFEAFAKLADGGKSIINADGVHPIAEGMRLQADVAKAFLAARSLRP